MLDFMRLLLFRYLLRSFKFACSCHEGMQFIPMALCKFGGALRQLSFKASPSILFILLVLGQKQSDGFLGTELGDSRKVLHA